MSEAKRLRIQAKLRALYRIWGGEKVTQVARDYGVSRQVVYTWKRKAERALYTALEKGKRSSKILQLLEEDQIRETQEKTRKPSLKHKIAQRKMKTLRDSSIFIPTFSGSQHSNNGKRPKCCPGCGFEKIYKNGTYIKKNQNNGSRKKEVVQRYICVWCKSSVYLY